MRVLKTIWLQKDGHKIAARSPGSFLSEEDLKELPDTLENLIKAGKIQGKKRGLNANRHTDRTTANKL